MKPARKRATYQDVIDLPEHLIGEIVEGELHTSPRPASPHAHASSVIGANLIGSFGGPPGQGDAPGGWWFLDEPELHFGSDVLVPDIAGWRRERMPAMPNVPYFTLAPDWVCEVVSPSTRTFDRGRKMGVYAREQIPFLWLVDPLAKTLETFRLGGTGWVPTAVHTGNDRVHAQPFDAVELSLQRWWLG